MVRYSCCGKSGCRVTAGLPLQLRNLLCTLDTLNPYLLEEEMPSKGSKQQEERKKQPKGSVRNDTKCALGGGGGKHELYFKVGWQETGAS